MYAIIKSGSRQYKVEPETIIEVNRLAVDAGTDFETDQVLLLEDDKEKIEIGTPFVQGAKVKGIVLDHFRGKKIIIFKHKRRKNYRRKRGHRQELTRVRISAIEIETAKAPAKAKPKEAGVEAKASKTKEPATDAKTSKPKAPGAAAKTSKPSKPSTTEE